MSRGPIVEHVATVNAALRGPRRVRADLLAELCDGLEDAAIAYEDKGLSRLEAERRAVAVAGSAAELVPDYQAEVAARQGVRTAVLLTLTMPANYLAWNLLWRDDTVVYTPTDLFRLMSELTDYAGLAAGGVALAGLALMVWFARTGRLSGGLARGLVAVEAVLLSVVVVCSVGMNVNDPAQTAEWLQRSTMPVAVVGIASVVLMAVQTRMLWRTFTLSARPAVA